MAYINCPDVETAPWKTWYPVVYGSGAGEAIDGQRRHPRKEIREWLLRIQDGKCGYCGRTFAETTVCWDHFKPFCIFGNQTQFVAACRKCNSVKGSKWFDNFPEARDYVLRRLNAKVQAQREKHEKMPAVRNRFPDKSRNQDLLHPLMRD